MQCGIIIPILRMGKLWFRKVKTLHHDQGITTCSQAFLVTKLLFSPPPTPNCEICSFSEAHRGDEIPAAKPRICEHLLSGPELSQFSVRLFLEWTDLCLMSFWTWLI